MNLFISKLECLLSADMEEGGWRGGPGLLTRVDPTLECMTLTKSLNVSLKE